MKLEDLKDAEKTVPEMPEDAKLKELYQLYLQKCCEVGQLRYNLDQLNSQRLEMEKTLEVTERETRKAAQDHRELQKAKFKKLKPVAAPEAPKLEPKEGVAH